MVIKRWLTLLFVLCFSMVVLSGCSLLDRKTKAGLQVITADIPSTLFLDDQYIDKTPYIGKEFKPGTYKLRIQPDDTSLSSYETTITLNKGLLTVVTWKPGPTPERSGGVIYEMEKLDSGSKSELSIISVPDGTIVTIPGKEKLFTPLDITDIDPGQVDIEFNLPSYDSQKHTVNILEGYKLKVSVKLAKSEVTTINTVPNTATTSATTSSTATSSARVTTPTASGSAKLGTAVKIKATNYFVNNQEVLRVRSSANPQASEVGTVPVGKQYPLLQSSEGWYQIEFDKKQGWVSGQYVSVVP